MSTIFVGNLPKDIREREVEDLFYKYGRVEDVQVRTSKNDTFAFVSFRDSRDAKDAIHGRDGYKFDGYRLKVEFSKRSEEERRGGSRRDRSRTPRRDFRMGDRYYKMSVTNLPEGTSWQDLKDHIRTICPVKFTEVNNDGTGVAGYDTKEELDEALTKLDDTNMKSHTGATSYIRVKAISRDEPMKSVETNQGGSGRSRSRSRSSGR